MKNFFKFLKNVKSTVFKSTNPYKNTDATSTFFKKAQAFDSANKYGSKAKIVVEDRIPQLDRMILTGSEKNRAIYKIEEIAFQANFTHIPENVKDACEVVHYHAINDLPVRVELVKLVLPDIEVDPRNIVNESEYEEWVNNKHKQKASESEIEIEDTYSMNMEGQRGKKAQEGWDIKGNKGDQWGNR